MSSAAVTISALRVECVHEQPGKTEAGTLISQSLKRTFLFFPSLKGVNNYIRDESVQHWLFRNMYQASVQLQI